MKVMFTPNHDPNYFQENCIFTNCGSYAFNIQGWYCPDENFDEDDEKLGNTLFEEDELTTTEILQLLFDRDVEQILNDFDLVRVYNKDIFLKSNEELVAFRMCVVPDFFDGEDDSLSIDYHFRVKRNGKWMEKIGCGQVHEVLNYSENPWVVSEFLIYSGPIAYFIRKVA